MRFKEKKEEPNSRKAYRYLVDRKGLEPHIAAGLVGNLMQESYMLDRTWVDGEVDDVGSVGVMQWHGSRLDNLYDFYAKQNPEYERGSEIPMQSQLDFIIHEATTGGGDPWLKKQYQKAFEAKTPKEATMAFSRYVVRPHKNYAHNDKRVSYASDLASSKKEDTGYDFFNDPDKLFTNENKKKPVYNNPKVEDAFGKIDKTMKSYAHQLPEEDNSIASMQKGGEVKKGMSVEEIANSREDTNDTDVYNAPELLENEKEWVKNWLQHPKSQERLRNNVGEVEENSIVSNVVNRVRNPFSSDEERIQNVSDNLTKDSLEEIDSQTTLFGLNVGEAYANSNELGHILRRYTGYGSLDPQKYMGTQDPSTNTTFVNNDYGMDESRVTAVHEYTHATPLDDYLTTILPESEFYGGKREVYPRIMQLRYLGDIKPDEKVTKEKLQKIKEKSPYEEGFFEAFSDEQILEMMNKLASTDSKEQKRTVTARRGRKIKK